MIFCIELMIMAMVKGLLILDWMIKIWIEVVRIDWWYTTLIFFILCNLSLELCSDWYGSHMVVVLCSLLSNYVALSALVYELY